MINPVDKANKVLENMICINSEILKGAHDPHFTIVDKKAYIVYMANELSAGEDCKWDHLYCVMSIVDIEKNEVEEMIPFAHSMQEYENLTLPKGPCYAPRVIKIAENKLRILFSVIPLDGSQAIIFYTDFDMPTRSFENKAFILKMRYEGKIEDMIPSVFYEWDDANQNKLKEDPAGLYLFEFGKKTDDKYYIGINNFHTAQNAFGYFNDTFDVVEIISFVASPKGPQLSELVPVKKPDGSWFGVLRNDAEDYNYYVTSSADGINFDMPTPSTITSNASNSKAFLEYLNGKYYLGWQQGPGRSKFSIATSDDCENWECEYTFEIPNKDFFYPGIVAFEDSIYICAVEGAKESIWFGKLA